MRLITSTGRCRLEPSIALQSMTRSVDLTSMTTLRRRAALRPGPRAAGLVLIILCTAAALLATLLVPQPSEAADMLICRKFDKEGDKQGRTIHLHGKGVKYSASDGNDTLYGTPNDDILQGGNGNDRVYGLGGDDIVCGGTGHDRSSGAPETTPSTARRRATRRMEAPETTTCSAAPRTIGSRPGATGSTSRTATTARTWSWAAPATRSSAAP